ncbi:helix-turn-helix transcriptional regulator [Brucepastera parasyntrophica]|uniref:helix-turn-helix transcriptional regulator n=1 Tax=Brucepastera parasyntrophica TaxID=2880008 RepID=UPI00210BFB27|nr:helix-turn-helix transcriptional regulator [Brucepastera parasyntrophica]ULQ59299.1 helix-turn-helix transcriptional regulator [Brucepastera parasyntrophica]
MYEWHRMVQIVVDEIDRGIRNSDDESLTLQSLSKKLGYSGFHTTRRFKELSGMVLRDYIRLRKLAFALFEVRDTNTSFLDIAVKYGFASHEAFTRAFKSAYGITPKQYRKNPQPVVLRTKINTFDRYIFGIGEIGMVKSTEEVKVYFVSMPAHRFLHIKNYESSGYFDFWEKQENIPGQDCHTICGLLDSIKEKLDGNANDPGKYSGQIMARIYEENGKTPEAYGVRLPATYSGPVPDNMLLIDIPETEYIVFEHGPFNYDEETETVGEKLRKAMDSFDFSKTAYKPDTETGRISYFYFDPESFEKRIQPVIKK